MTLFSQLNLGRCRLVLFSQQHLNERYVSWLNDPEVVRYSEQRHRQHTLQSCADYFAAVTASDDLFLALEVIDSPLGHIGNFTVSFDHNNRSADVSVMIGEASARGTGLGTLAWRGLIDWLLTEGGMRRVTAGTMAANKAMIALMTNSGMDIEAVRPRVFLLDGEEIDMVLAARFAKPAPLQE